MTQSKHLNIYSEIYRFEDIVLQSNLEGYYTKRIKVNMQELETIKHNHRKIGINEVVFDIDCHIPEIYNPIWDRISTNLQRDNISHQCWFTSRSPHIHLFFEGLNLYPQEARRIIKLFILKEYSQNDFQWLDKSMINHSKMIRDFNTIHEDTRKINTLIYEFQRINYSKENPIPSLVKQQASETLNNPIPSKILDKVRNYYNQQRKVAEIEPIAVTGPDKKELQNFITYCLENQHTQDGRERILFKNVAIACLLLGYDTNQRTRIYYNIVKNCNGRNVNELIGWDKFMQKQSRLWFNWGEVKEFYKVQMQGV